MESYKKTFKLGENEITLESGKVARQATGAVVQPLEIQVLATVVVGKAPGEHQDFFPLTVNYQEKTYATGKIPGGFLREKEGRQKKRPLLLDSLIDPLGHYLMMIFYMKFKSFVLLSLLIKMLIQIFCHF